jgi:hypothetical protein
MKIPKRFENTSSGRESKHSLFILSILSFLSMLLILSSCHTGKDDNKVTMTGYDMRRDLSPSRLTIAMWDYSWLKQHYPGGYFEDYNTVTNELIARGFNTVRIEAFPFIIDRLDSLNQVITIKGEPMATWGACDTDRKHELVSELISFMKTAKEKGLYVILSTWNTDCKEFSDFKDYYSNKDKYRHAWEKVLDILNKNNLLDHVVYVDIDQEFPNFSPFKDNIINLGDKKEPSSAFLSAELKKHNSNDLTSRDWNESQMTFVHDLIQETLLNYHIKYPALRFTFSFTDHWDEFRAMNLNLLDVLELHIWMEQSERFNARTRFNDMVRDRGDHDYREYMGRLDQTLASIRPMLIKDMHNRLAWARSWSEELAAPLTTTEAWGPWWHMDRKDLDWKWLYDWCEECMDLSASYGFWGSTPWNFSHPYWNNWSNVDWYKKVNTNFLQR